MGRWQRSSRVWSPSSKMKMTAGRPKKVGPQMEGCSHTLPSALSSLFFADFLQTRSLRGGHWGSILSAISHVGVSVD